MPYQIKCVHCGKRGPAEPTLVFSGQAAESLGWSLLRHHDHRVQQWRRVDYWYCPQCQDDLDHIVDNYQWGRVKRSMGWQLRSVQGRGQQLMPPLPTVYEPPRIVQGTLF